MRSPILKGGIILGIKEKKTADGSVYVVNGVPNPEQMEQDIITTLRSRTKFNAPVSYKAIRYKIDCKDILAFEIPLSPHRHVAIKSSGEVYIRTGSGDNLATDLEVDAIVRDASFGAKSEVQRCKNIGVGVMLGAENYALATSHSV